MTAENIPRRGHGESGSASVELVLVTPVLLVLLAFVIFLGRTTAAAADVQAAARDSARSASLARTPTASRSAGTTSAQASITAGGVTCRQLNASIDTAEFRPGGTVTATVTCEVALGDVSLLGVAPTRTVSASFTAPVDSYRGASR